MELSDGRMRVYSTSRLKAFREGGGIVQGMPRKGSCIDNGAKERVFGCIEDVFPSSEYQRPWPWLPGAKERVFGCIEDEFFGSQNLPDFDPFKAALGGYVIHWSTRKCQATLKGLTPDGLRRQALQRCRSCSYRDCSCLLTPGGFRRQVLQGAA